MKALSTKSGSALLISIITVAILTAIGAGAISLIINNRSTLSQAAAWKEALIAAESGIHQAMTQAQEQLLPQLNQTIPPDLSSPQTMKISLTHGGEGATASGAQYVIATNYVSVSASGTTSRPYFKIVSTGSCQISGIKSISRDAQDIVLRKLSLTSGTIPTATRQIEAWLKPVYSRDAAITTKGLISLNNHNITVDSFNSKDSKRSIMTGSSTIGQPSDIIAFFNSMAINHANGGTLDKDYWYANIGTNGQLIMSGNSYIYGDAMTNGGVTTNATNVYGTIRDDFYQSLTPVLAPNGTFVYPTVPNGRGNQTSTLTSMKNNDVVTLKGGTQSSPARYVLDSLSLTGGGQLTFDFGNIGGSTNTNPDAKYVELYVKGDFSTKGGGNGDGSIIIQNGVQVKIYVGGNMAFGGNGITNNNGSADSLSIYGITPTDGSTRTADFGGTSAFYGTVYAPDFDLTLGGNPTYVGSLVGKTATLVGNVNLRYDEALGSSGAIINFGVASWFENPMKVP